MKSEDLFMGIGAISDRWLTEAEESVAFSSAAKKSRKQHSLPTVIAYEMRKVLSTRYLWIFFLVMLLINSALARGSVENSGTAEENRVIAQFVEGYFENPEEYDAHYERILAFNKEQTKLMKEAFASGNDDFVLQHYPNVYSPYDHLPDEMLFDALYSAMEAAREFPGEIQRILDNARLNLDSLSTPDASEQDYAIRYQMEIIEIYGEIYENTRIGVEYVRGWEDFFNHKTTDFFIAVIILMISTLVFAQEKQTGFLPVLRSTPKGRLTTALGKLLVLMITVAVTIALFTLSTFAIFGITVGYSSPMNAIQAIEGFELVPYSVTVGEYFLLTLGVKVLAFSLFGLAVAAISVTLSNYTPIFIGGFALWGGSVLLDANLPRESLLRAINLASVANSSELFTRFRSFHLFGTLCDHLTLILIVYTVAALFLGAFCILMHRWGFVGIRFAPFDRLRMEGQTVLAKISTLLSKIRRRKKRRARTFSASLISAEIFKTLISSRFLFALILILIAKILFSAELYSAPKSYADEVYLEYTTRLEGELTEEKIEWIRSEREAIDTVLRQKDEMQFSYRKGEIDFNAYYDYLSRFHYAQARNEPLQIIEKHAEYLTKANNGGWFLYDTGWQKLYCGEADLFLYTAILLLLAGIFASEYFSRGGTGGFARILRSTKKGREKTFSAKLICGAMMASSLTLISCGIDAVTVFLNYEMPALSAPLASMEEFSTLSPNLTVGGYLIVFLLLRILGALFMAMLVCALSEILRKYLPVLGTAIVLTLLPAFCAGFGIRAAESLNFLNLFSGTSLLLDSAKASLFGSDWAMLALWITTAFAAVGGIMIPARKTYVKG